MDSVRFLPTSVHGVLDYLVGIALIAAPWLFGFAYVGGIAVYLPIILGIGLLIPHELFQNIGFSRDQREILRAVLQPFVADDQGLIVAFQLL